MAGACAVEVKGRANVAADKREIRSLFMGSNILKINKDIVSPEGGANLTRQIHCQVRERDAVRLGVPLETVRLDVRFAWR